MLTKYCLITQRDTHTTTDLDLPISLWRQAEGMDGCKVDSLHEGLQIVPVALNHSTRIVGKHY